MEFHSCHQTGILAHCNLHHEVILLPQPHNHLPKENTRVASEFTKDRTDSKARGYTGKAMKVRRGNRDSLTISPVLPDTAQKDLTLFSSAPNTALPTESADGFQKARNKKQPGLGPASVDNCS
ncbi:hypothetical protein AAY473_010824 [Plecturocebus cupreus]